MWFFNNHSIYLLHFWKMRDLRHGYLQAEMGCELCGQVTVEAETEVEILEGGF